MVERRPACQTGSKSAYDDKLNLKITGFAATYTNNGKSYVKSNVVDKRLNTPIQPHWMVT